MDPHLNRLALTSGSECASLVPVSVASCYSPIGGVASKVSQMPRVAPVADKEVQFRSFFRRSRPLHIQPTVRTQDEIDRLHCNRPPTLSRVLVHPHASSLPGYRFNLHVPSVVTTRCSRPSSTGVKTLPRRNPAVLHAPLSSATILFTVHLTMHFKMPCFSHSDPRISEHPTSLRVCRSSVPFSL